MGCKKNTTFMAIVLVKATQFVTTTPDKDTIEHPTSSPYKTVKVYFIGWIQSVCYTLFW